jgi:hypothetical protein
MYDIDDAVLIMNQRESKDSLEVFPFEEAKDVLYRGLGLCGCGSGKDFELLLEVLEISEMNGNEKYTDEDRKIGCMYNSPGRELAAKVLDSAGWIEHGSGIGWPWITDVGKTALRIIRCLPKDRRDAI